MKLFTKKMYGIGASIILFGFMMMAAASVLIDKVDNSPKTSKDINNSTASQAVVLDKLYDSSKDKFTIKYPADWEADMTQPGLVIFSGKKETPAYYSTVSIQAVRSKKSGGTYVNTKEAMADIRAQVLKESPKTTFLAQGPFTLILPDESRLNGEYVIFIYSYQGSIIQQWQVIVSRKDGRIFYTWAYTSPMEQYGKYLDVAKQMLSTWTIY